MTTSKMMKIDAGLLKQNPHRDFVINPVDDQQVEELRKSYQNVGDFGSIPVRKMPDGTYEIAAGHHRLSAMRSLGLEKIDCKVIDADDDQMFRMMVSENATQHGGKPSSQADSVAAAMRRLAYFMFIAEDTAQFNKLAGMTIFGEYQDSGFARAKADLQKTAVVGRRPIVKYLKGALNDNVVRETVDSLSEVGHARYILDLAAQDAKEYFAAQEAEAKEARAKEEAIRKREEEAAKKAAADAKRKAAEAQKALVTARKLAERAKEEQERLKLLKDQARKEKAAKDAAAREAAKEAAYERALAQEKQRRKEEESRLKLQKQREAEREQAQAAAKQQQEDSLIDPRALAVLVQRAQVREFKRIVRLKPELYGKDVWDQAKDLAKWASKEREASTSKRTSDLSVRDAEFLDVSTITHNMMEMDKKLKAAQAQVLKDREERKERENLESRVNNRIKEAQHAVAEVAMAFKRIEDLLGNPEAEELIMGHPNSSDLRHWVRELYKTLPKIEKAFRVSASTLKGSGRDLYENDEENIIDIN